MGSRAFLVLGLLFAIFFLALEVSAIELTETEQRDETNGLEESKYGVGCTRICCGGGGYPRRERCCHYGCCGVGYRCRCCASAAEAEAYAAADAKAKPQN